VSPSHDSAREQRPSTSSDSAGVAGLNSAIARVTLDRPESRNAVNAAMHRGLEIVFRELSHHPDVGAIVLTGAGDVFCAGGDLKNYGGNPTPLETMRNRDLNWSMARCEAPTLCAVNGAARGVGASIALLCDIVYMADTASIGDVHTPYGLPAGDGGQVIWPLLVGPNLAKEYLMRGIAIDAREAERIGLVNRVVPADELAGAALDLAEGIAGNSPFGVWMTKRGLERNVDAPSLEELFDASRLAMRDAYPEVEDRWVVGLTCEDLE